MKEKTIQAARNYAAQIHHAIADNVFTADAGYASHVTNDNKRDIAKKHRTLAAEIEAGEHDHNLTVAQRMHYFLTGECVAILP